MEIVPEELNVDVNSKLTEMEVRGPDQVPYYNDISLPHSVMALTHRTGQSCY